MKIIILTICLLALVGCGNQEFIGADEISKVQKLKASTDKILDSIVIDDIRCDGADNCTNHGPVKKYAYVSENKVIDKSREDKSKRTSNSRYFKIDDNTTKIQFYSSDQFKKDGDDWFHIEVATSTIEVFNKETSISFLERLLGQVVHATDFFSGAGDGVVERLSQATWTAARDTASGTSADYTSATDYLKAEYDSGSGGYACGRLFLPFDTSSLDDGVSISTATLKLYVADEAGTMTFGVIQTSQADTSQLGTGDFDAMTIDSPDEGTDSRVSVTNNQYNDFTLNSTGMGWISTTGYTTLGVRTTRDIDDTQPPSSPRQYRAFRLSEYAGTDSDPVLEVTISSDTCTYSGAGDWNIKAKDNCYVTENTTVNGVINLLADEGEGVLYIINNAVLSAGAINSTSTPVHADSGASIKIGDST